MTTYTLTLVMLLTVFTNASLTLALLAFPATAAEQAQVPPFKNVDEMIGWLKAKGDCKELGVSQKTKKPIGKKCETRIDLPNDERVEGNEKGVWQVHR